MNKKLIPTYFEDNFYSLDFKKIKDLGYLLLFVDLDNTLASPFEAIPSDKTRQRIKEIKYLGFDITVLSNNHQERVAKFCDSLDVNYIYEVKKPNATKFNKYLDDNKIDKTKTLVIGDQVMTDVLLANRVGVDVILLNPLTSKDQLITFFPRRLDKYFKWKLRRKKLIRRLKDG